MSTFPRLFNAAVLGRTLKEVSTDLLQTTHHEIISRWFHSEQDADLFLWSDLKHNVIKQQLSFHGQVVEWNVVEGLKTGMLIEDENEVSARASEILQFDARPQPGPLRQAIDLITHTTSLKEHEREILTRNFRASVQTKPRRGFWSRFWRGR